MEGERRTAAPRTAKTPASRPGPDAALFDRALDGDGEAFDQLVRYFMPMAKRIARATQSRLVESEDLEQVAFLALVLALRRFDPGRGVAFATFAKPTISGEIKRHLRDRGWSVRVPRILQETALRVQKVTTEFSSSHGRAPTANELAELIGAPVEFVLEAIEANQAIGSASLDAEASDSEDGRAPLMDRIGAEDPRFDSVEKMASVSASIRMLDPRDRLVLYLRFVEDKTQSDIAAEVGVSQMHVSRLLRAALKKVRALEAGSPGVRIERRG